MGADAFGQAVIDRREWDVLLEHPEAALDLGKSLVTIADFGAGLITHARKQDQIAVASLLTPECDVIEISDQAAGSEISLQDFRSKVRRWMRPH